MKSDKKICCRCYQIVDELVPSNCSERPELLKGQPLGQYHCPDCGAMVVAGLPHPDLCKPCSQRKHPRIDKIGKLATPIVEYDGISWSDMKS